MDTNTCKASLDGTLFPVRSRGEAIILFALYVAYSAWGIGWTVAATFPGWQLLAAGDWDRAGLARYGFILLVGCLHITFGLLFTGECLLYSALSLHLDDRGNLVVDTLMRQRRIQLASIREIQIDATHVEGDETMILIVLRPRGRIIMPSFPDYEKFLELILTVQPSIPVIRLPELRPATP